MLSGNANWFVDISAYAAVDPNTPHRQLLGKPSGPATQDFTCNQQALALSGDETLLYLICNTHLMLAVNTSNGGKFFLRDYTQGQTSSVTQTQLIHSPVSGGRLLTVYNAVTVYILSALTGEVITSLPSVNGQQAQIFLRDMADTNAYLRRFTPANQTEPGLNSWTTFSIAQATTATTHKQATASNSSTPIVLGVASAPSRSSTSPSRLYLFTFTPANKSHSIVVLNSDLNAPVAVWDAGQSVDLAESIASFNPSGVIESADGSIVYSRSLQSPSFNGYSTSTGALLQTVTLSFPVTYATVSFDTSSNRFFLVTPALLVIFRLTGGSATSPSSALLTYDWIMPKYYGTQKPIAMYTFNQDGPSQDYGGVAVGDATLGVTYIVSVNGILLTGVDVSGAPFQSLFGTTYTRGCSLFDTSCDECQVDSIATSGFVCTWSEVCGCQPMWSGYCMTNATTFVTDSSITYLNTSSTLCSSTLPADIPAYKQAAFWVVFVLILIALLAIGIYYLIKRKAEKRAAGEEVGSGDYYQPATM
jgi:hypothetical protein